jgi:hypothetical protein
LHNFKVKDFKGIVTWWFGRGFGEALVASLFCHILNDNGIPSVHREHYNSKGLLDVPIWNPKKYKDWTMWNWAYKRIDIPVLLQQIKRAERWLGVKINIDRKRNHIPVKFDKVVVEKFDVVANTRTGEHTPFKEWPYFGDLKRMFKKEGISFLDMDAHEAMGMKCLSYVRKAKLYLGLDTGMSHYVSKFANGKALIINGGFVTFNFWGFLYDYDVIQIDDVPCRPCYINRGDIEHNLKDCRLSHMCMMDITPRMVFERICEKLNG